MKKLTISLCISILSLPFFMGFSEKKQTCNPLVLFPEITVSSSAEFDSDDNSDEKVEVIEQNKKPQIKFKIVELLLSVFQD